MERGDSGIGYYLYASRPFEEFGTESTGSSKLGGKGGCEVTSGSHVTYRCRSTNRRDCLPRPREPFQYDCQPLAKTTATDRCCLDGARLHEYVSIRALMPQNTTGVRQGRGSRYHVLHKIHFTISWTGHLSDGLVSKSSTTLMPSI